MSERPDDSDFSARWRAFAKDDARVRAPIQLRARIISACRTQAPARVGATWALLGAAAAVVFMAGLWLWRAPAPTRPMRDRASLSSGSPLGSNVDSARPSRVAEEVGTSRPPVAGGTEAGAIATARPAAFGELVQIVRVRIPREALDSFGLALVDDPMASVSVDVDLVVGDDGIVKDIRDIHPSQLRTSRAPGGQR